MLSETLINSTYRDIHDAVTVKPITAYQLDEGTLSGSCSAGAALESDIVVTDITSP